MTRGLVTSLLVLNAALAAVAFGPGLDALWPLPGQAPREPERLALQVRPESILVAGRQPSVAPPAVPSSAVEPSGGASAAATAASAAPTPTVSPAPLRSPEASSLRPSERVSTPPPSPPVDRVQDTDGQQQAQKPPEP